MAYDTSIADEIRVRIGSHTGMTEREMFGGIAFMIHGNMAIGVSREELMVRVGKEAHDEAVTLPGARIFDMSGRPMRGWLAVAREGFADEDAMNSWIDRGVRYAQSLPKK